MKVLEGMMYRAQTTVPWDWALHSLRETVINKRAAP